MLVAKGVFISFMSYVARKPIVNYSIDFATGSRDRTVFRQNGLLLNLFFLVHDLEHCLSVETLVVKGIRPSVLNSCRNKSLLGVTRGYSKLKQRDALEN